MFNVTVTQFRGTAEAFSPATEFVSPIRFAIWFSATTKYLKDDIKAGLIDRAVIVITEGDGRYEFHLNRVDGEVVSREIHIPQA